MKIKKLLIAFLAALSLIVLAAGLSACDFIDGIFGDEPQNPPSGVQPPDTDPEPNPPPQPEICVHVYGEWTDEINNCNVHKVKRVCSLCGDIEYDFLEAGHIYGPWTDIVNNCTVHTQKRFCTECGAIQTNSLPAKGHSYGEWTDYVNSCTIHTQKRVCSACNDQQFQSLSAKGHSYGEWEVVTDTCTEHVQKRVCSECKEEEEKTLTPIGHRYGEWIDEVKTCTQHIQKQTCSGCGDFKKRAMKTDGHKYADGVCEVCKLSVADGEYGIDKYNGDYGYNYFKQNNLTAQQTLYERIDAGVRAFHLDKTANAEQKLQNGKTVYIAATAEYSDLALSADEAVSVWKTFKDDNPLYYWLSGELVYTAEELYMLAVEDYAQGDVRIRANDFVYNKVAEYSFLLDVNDNAYRKALAFHDKIITSVDYAYESVGVPQTAHWAHSVIGVFEERGAVCESYAKTFQLLLNYNGVENIFVTGRGNSEEHAWNLVRLDNGGWYWCDLTWDDTPSEYCGISYRYFLVNDTQQVNWLDGGGYYNTVETFLTRHTPHTAQGTSIQFLYELPARATANYAEENGLTLRKTFSVNGFQYAVAGYNTVQLVKKEAAGAVTVPETVTYDKITYTVVAIGVIDAKGLFGSGSVFKGATSVFIPKTVQFIWDSAMVCSVNTSVTVDAENEYFCSVDGVLFTKSMKTLVNYPANRADGEYRIPEQTEWLATGAFSLIKNLSRLYVGKNVVIDGIACWGVYYDNSRNTVSGGWRNIAYNLKLTENTGIIVDEENPAFSSDDKWLYSKDKTKAYCYFNREATEIEIPATVTSFDSSVFMNYMKLERFTVAEGNTAFAVQNGILYNKAFTEIIHIPNHVSGTVTLPSTITQLGGSTSNFGNSYITEINISVTLEELGIVAFYNPYWLERINYGGTMEQWLAIEKHDKWVYGTEKFVIVCTDGVLDIHGNLII
ncbi:MAG: leucine-rich repeat protein [Clostridia bacterium]|nr:leucine-rich repeat protein [Clostridia bacterium]